MTVPSTITDLSTTAASNDPQGSENIGTNLDNYLRAIQAILRSESLNKEWEDHPYTHTYASGTSFTISGTDVTGTYSVGRRIRAVGSSTGTIYGQITASSFVTNTTVTISWDSGSLQNESLTISLASIKGGSSGQTIDLDGLAGTLATTQIADNAVNQDKISDTLINGLTAITTLQTTDQLAVADNSDSDNNKKITVANLLTTLAATDSQAGFVEEATQPEMEAETNAKFPDAALVKYSPGAAKFWVNFNGTGTIAIREDYNVSGLVDNGVTDYTVTIDNDMANANYCLFGMCNDGNGSGEYYVDIISLAAGSARVDIHGEGGSAGYDADQSIICVGGFGSLA